MSILTLNKSIIYLDNYPCSYLYNCNFNIHLLDLEKKKKRVKLKIQFTWLCTTSNQHGNIDSLAQQELTNNEERRNAEQSHPWIISWYKTHPSRKPTIPGPQFVPSARGMCWVRQPLCTPSALVHQRRLHCFCRETKSRQE